MSGIESDVLAAFAERLKTSADVPAAVTDQLIMLLAQEKLPKADELAALYSAESGSRVA